ncbi:LysR substrate-binding domain-containing protein [Streptomyces violaceusniger]|uniref:LysR family transcriptional regulator n=1 Tax=Streptomyces violaceusniger TaxID=68280 RepID=UPI003438C8A5
MGMDPTFQQLRVFLTVAEELHFGRAAERLAMTQPPVSRQVRALEKVVGVPLFDRTSRHVALTPAGEVLHAEAARTLTSWGRAVQEAAHVARGLRRALVLGCVEAVALELLPSVVNEIRRTHPQDEWELREGDTSDLLAGLHARELDCAVVRGPVVADAEVLVRPLFDDPLVMALPSAHPHGGSPIEWSALAEEDFVVYRRDVRQGLLPVLLDGCARAGFTPRIRYQATATELLLGLVAAGDGVALVSSAVARSPRAGVRFVPLAGGGATSPLLFVWRRGAAVGAVKRIGDLLWRAAAERRAAPRDPAVP